MSEQARIIHGGAQTWQLSGALVYRTVSGLLREANSLRASGGWPEALDLQAVTHSDSAGLALLVELLRLARLEQHDLRFNHPPPQLLRIAKVGGLDELLLGQNGQSA